MNGRSICSQAKFPISRLNMAVTGTFCGATNPYRKLLRSKTGIARFTAQYRSYGVAAKLAERAQTRLKETKDPQLVAKELAAEANMQPAEMVKETDYIRPGDDVPDIGSNQQFEQAIAVLNNPNDVGERTGVKGGFAIPMFVDKKDPRIPEFDEVKDKVAQSLKQERAKSQLEQKARELAGSIKAPGDIKAAGEKAGFEVANELDFKLGATLGKAGTSPSLDEAIYALKEGDVTKTPVKVGDSWIIIGATQRVEPEWQRSIRNERGELLNC